MPDSVPPGALMAPAPEFADFRQGLRVQAVMDAAHLSADEGRTVEVETPSV